MTHTDSRHHRAGLTRRTVALSLGAAMGVATLGRVAIAQEGDARAALRRMSDYLASAKTIAASFDSTIEVVTPSLQKIQFTSSGKLALERPGKLRVERTGGYADVTFVFDGQTLSVFEKDRNVYAQAPVAGDIDAMLEALRKDLSIEPPGADLLGSNPYEALMASTNEGRQIGRGVVSGVECDHFAFRGDEVDWQIWIETGAAPAPRKYVITSKAVAGAPEYALVIRDWRTGGEITADNFEFAPPAGARKIVVAELTGFDEVPPASMSGEKK